MPPLPMHRVVEDEEEMVTGPLAASHEAAAPQPIEGPEDHGDLGIRIDRDGRWYYHGSPIHRKEMVCLFASMLTRDEDGGYRLTTSEETGRIEVEDVPLLVVELFRSGAGREMTISFRTNVDEIVPLDSNHLLRISEDAVTGEPIPYLLVREGIEAKLTRAVYYDLVALGYFEIQGDEEIFGLWSNGTFFTLGRLQRAE